MSTYRFTGMAWHAKSRQRIWLSVLGLLLAAIFVSCQPAAPTTPAPPIQPVAPPSGPSQPAPQPPSAPPGSGVKWVADGKITPGEYPKSKAYGDYEISWSADDQYIYIAMKAKTTGWVAVGFGPETLMKNADIVEGYVSDAKLTIQDMFSTGDFGPHPPDIQQGGTNDILESGGTEENGYTVIEFKHKLDTGDKFDKPLIKGTNKILWAYGSDDQPFLKHLTRGYGELDL